MLGGDVKTDLAALRDYLFRLASSLQTISGAAVATDITYVGGAHAGSGGIATQQDIKAVRQNARELQSLIIKTATGLQDQIDHIETVNFFVKYADDFEGSYPSAMYSTPTENTVYMGVCSAAGTDAPTDPSEYTWSKVKGAEGTSGINAASVFLYQRAASAASLTKPVGNVYYSFRDGVIEEKNLLPDFGTFGTSSFPDGTCQWNAEKTEAVIDGTTRYRASIDVYSGEVGISMGEGSSEYVLPEPLEFGVSYTIHFTSTDPNITLSVYPCSSELITCESGEDAVFTLTSGTGIAFEIMLKIGRDVTVDNATVQISMVETNSGIGDWHAAIPASNGSPCFFIQAMASASNDKCVIAASDWSDIKKLVEDGTPGTPGLPGQNGKTTYLHIKYSDDGETFTVNPETGIADGETLGAFIGMYTDYTQADSMTFSDYVWHRFADDTELMAAIDAGDNAVMQYADSKVEEYNSLYVAKSEYGEFQETITTTIENTAKGVVESYNYGSAIESVQEDIKLVQDYYTSLNGEIRRGIIQDPDTGDYVTGIAISQNLQFSGECGSTDPLNPGDGHTYYYLIAGQTFGLYTSTGWQFWIDGVKRGWFNSADGMLHVKNVWVDSILHIGANWTVQQSGNALMISYVG